MKIITVNIPGELCAPQIRLPNDSIPAKYLYVVWLIECSPTNDPPGQ